MNMNELTKKEYMLVTLYRMLSSCDRSNILQLVSDYAEDGGLCKEQEIDSVEVIEDYQVILQLHGTCMVNVFADDVEQAIAAARAECVGDIAMSGGKCYTRVVDVTVLPDE